MPHSGVGDQTIFQRGTVSRTLQVGDVGSGWLQPHFLGYVHIFLPITADKTDYE